MYCKLRFIYKYERKPSVSTSEVSSRITLDVGVMDFQNGLLAESRQLKCGLRKALNGDAPHFCVFKHTNLFSRFSLHIKKNISISPLMLITGLQQACSTNFFLFFNFLFSALLISYFSTFTYPLACTGSAISSFLLFITNKLMK